MANEMYYLESGKAERIIRRGFTEARRISIDKGDLFGEAALFSSSTRRTDVKTIDIC